jgi:Choline/Carnitine o-acyltransferase
MYCWQYDLITGGALEGASLFTDPLFTRSSTWTLSTSNVTQPFLSSFGFGPVVSTGYGIGYLVHVSVECHLCSDSPRQCATCQFAVVVYKL